MVIDEPPSEKLTADPRNSKSDGRQCDKSDHDPLHVVVRVKRWNKESTTFGSGTLRGSEWPNTSKPTPATSNEVGSDANDTQRRSDPAKSSDVSVLVRVFTVRLSLGSSDRPYDRRRNPNADTR